MKKLYTQILIGLSLLVAVVLLFDKNAPQHYNKLFLLPLFFSIVSFLFINIYDNFLKKLSITILIGSYFVRLVILPLIIFISDYEIIVAAREQVISESLIAEQLPRAIFLMCYEVLLVFYIISRFQFNDSSFFKQYINHSYKTSILFKEVFFVIIIFCAISIALYPQLLSYTELFMSDPIKTNYRQARALYVMKEVTPSIIYWAYLFFFGLLQVFIPILLIDRIYKKLNVTKPLVSLLLSFLVLLATFAIMSPEKATSIQLGLTLFIVLCMLYPKQLRLIAPISISSMGVLIVFALLFKSGVFTEDSNSVILFSKISTIINAYFSGPANVATSLCIKEKVSFSIIVADIFNSIPFVGYFFQDLNNSPKIFNALIHNEEKQYLIIPMIGQGKFYFGYVLAPALTLIVVYSALWFERLADRTSYLLKKYIFLYAALLLSMAPVMYNLNIFIASFWTVVFCLIIMAFAYTRIYNSGKLKYKQ